MESNEEVCRILQLSDCTMMYILSYLDATSLFNLSRTCLYFKNIIKDPRLWQYIDARSKPNTTKKVEYICERIYDKTTHLFLKAESKYNGNVPQKHLISWMYLENLVILALENQRFDGKTLFLSNFPKSLVELSLKKTYVKNGNMFFHGSFQRMRNLRVLILDECDWVDSNFLLSVAKYENLELLSIVKCQSLHFNVMPYLSVAKHGFKNLKIIDTRFNTISNDILRTFNSHQSVLALYCQSMRTYELDKGRPLLKDGYHLLGNENKHMLTESTIKNETLEQFLQAVGGSYEELPESVLYQDPYPECTCGYKDNFNKEHNSLNITKCKDYYSPHMYADDFINFRPFFQKFLCRKHLGELRTLPQCNNIADVGLNTVETDSSDSETDSEDHTNCCMFGMERRKQIIVLKVRETDEQGNMPAAEVIDFSESISLRKKLKPNGQSETNEEQRNVNPSDPQPSTSRHQETDSCFGSDSSRISTKRKAEKCLEINQKKLKAGESAEKHPDLSEASTSKMSSDNGSNTNNVEGEAKNDYQITDQESSEDDDVSQNEPATSRQENRINADVNAEEEPEVSLLQLPTENNAIHLDIFGLRLQFPERRYRYGERPQKKLNLRRLSLRGYRKITDVVFRFVKNLNLDLLDVTYTNVTKEGIWNFLVSNPNCRVIHEDFCVCTPRIPC